MRHLWKANLSFGLINIPIELYSAVKEHQPKFKLLHDKDLGEIRYARICKAENKEVPHSQLVKGIEKNGRYVVLKEEDFLKAQSEKSKIIEIISFCPSKEIDTIYYEKPYFIKADNSGEKAYFLLEQALRKTNKLALVRYSLRNRNHIAAIMPYNNILLMNELRFYNQIINSKNLDINTKIRVSTKEIEMAEKLIEQLSATFEPAEFHDSYVENLEEIIASRTSKNNKKIKNKIKAGEEKLAEVYDIMALLKESLKEKRRSTR